MRSQLVKIIASFALTICVIVESEAQMRWWYKGNTHTHTLNSDGDSAPADVVKWYRDNGYHFLFITDHEFITPTGPLNEQFGKPGEFLVIQGQEITDSLDKKPHHVNALGIDRVIMPQKGKTVPGNIQQNVDRVRSVGGVPQINHPNFGWALTANDIRQVRNVTLMEIHNGHPLVNNLGGGGSPGAEEIWDSLLSTGMVIYGIASDDSHYFKRPGVRSLPTPGQAWIFVKAKNLNSGEILGALDRGDFYGSTGVELADYQADSRHISIKVKEEKSSRYKIVFIGRNGRILKTENSGLATYKIHGNEVYVRAKIIESNGKMAWTQPVFVGGK